MLKNWLLLALAIVVEVTATSALNASAGFTRPLPVAITIVGYLLSFYLLALVLKVFPVGVVYAIWAGSGIVLISLVGWAFFKQKLDLPAALGMSMIVGGVLVIRIFSRTVSG
jgi:small multidrug resistance pump